MARTLIVFHSRTGTCRQLARELGRAHDWPVAEIEMLPRAAPMWRCALDALLRRRPRIGDVGADLDGYDVVVLVAPIWIGRLSPPMRSFVASNASRLAQVAVMSAMGGQGADQAVADVRRLLGHDVVATTAFLEADVRAGRHHGQLRAFGERILASVARDMAGQTGRGQPARQTQAA